LVVEANSVLGQILEPTNFICLAIINSLRRVLSGVVALWCLLAPFGLFVLYPKSEEAPGPFLFLLLVAATLYGLVISRWWRTGFGFVKLLLRDGALCTVFALYGGLIAGALTAFAGIQLHKTGWFVAISILVCFWILELRTTKAEISGPS